MALNNQHKKNIDDSNNSKGDCLGDIGSNITQKTGELMSDELAYKIDNGESILGEIGTLKWTHRCDLLALMQILKSKEITSNSNRGVNFWLGKGAGYGDVQLIMKDTIQELEPASYVPGTTVPYNKNMAYFFPNCAAAVNPMNTYEYSQNFGDFRHKQIEQGNNAHINVPYLFIGQNTSSNAVNSVDIEYIEAIMIPQHNIKYAMYKDIISDAEKLGIKIILLDTPQSALEYIGLGILNHDNFDNDMGTAGDLAILHELKNCYPDIKDIDDKKLQFLIDTGAIKQGESFHDCKEKYTNECIRNGLSRGRIVNGHDVGGQYFNYPDNGSDLIEQKAYFKYLYCHHSELTKTIALAENIEDIKNIIISQGGIQTSNGYQSAEVLLMYINSEVYHNLPGDFGLKDKVIKLFNHTGEDSVISLNDIKSCLRQTPFSAQNLINILKKEFGTLYLEDVGVWQEYNLEQHTIMAMSQFEKHYVESGILKYDIQIMRLILAIHDIGKPLAVQEGDKQLQHKYNKLFISNLLRKLNLDSNHYNLIIILCSNNSIGEYLKGELSLEESANQIINQSESANKNLLNYFQIICIYYKSDASSYTMDAGGPEALDRLFSFNENQKGIQFSEDIQKKIDLLESTIIGKTQI